MENLEWFEYIKRPGEDRPCLTPGSQFHIYTGEDNISVSVDLPIKLDLSEEEAEDMEDAMHDAMEAILAKHFKEHVDLKELVTLADHLDRKGLVKEADYLDGIINKVAAIDDEERGVLNKLKDLFMKRDPVESSERAVNTDVPYDIKLKMWNYRSGEGQWFDYKNQTLDDDRDPTDEDFKKMGIEFWEVEPGDTGYEDSFEQGWIDESGKVYYGEQ